jgi:RNA-directed DNA polymerase
MEMRVEEGGESEGCSVMEQIGVESEDNITSRASEQTSTWSFMTRTFEEPTKEIEQMTAEQQAAGAVSHQEVDWQAIDWRTAHTNVSRLQTRIVKATQEGRWGKVKALQHLLTHSFSGKAIAVKRVTENQGKNTPGVDKVAWDSPRKKAAAIYSLRRRGYHPQPLRRIYIPKSNGRKRPLGIPTMRDRAMQALYLLALDPIAETLADPNSYGFRRERSTADAVEQCFTLLATKNKPQWILEGDIKACFDRISHDWLLAHIPMDKGILRKWLKAGYIEKNVLRPTEEGTPQGGICSPVLANMALDGLERRLREKYPKRPGHGSKGMVNLVRYADDFLVTSNSKETLENEVKPLIEQFMQERGLELSREKTVITHIEAGFDFLGQNVRKYKGKLLIKPSKKKVTAFLTKIRAIIHENKQAAAGHLILQLNPVIRGWANYHRHVVSKDTFTDVDHAIFETLWRWARRRHPNKGKKWIKEKYFLPIEGRKWVFSGRVRGKDGDIRTIQLLRAVDTPIVRHTKIQSAANPYDPEWETYFEQRLDLKMAADLKKKRKLFYLWKEQNGLCPVCDQRITKLTGWHSHHIMWRVYGGDDGTENRVLLHPNCHRQVHSRKDLAVVKPRPARGVRKA